MTKTTKTSCERTVLGAKVTVSNTSGSTPGSSGSSEPSLESLARWKTPSQPRLPTPRPARPTTDEVEYSESLRELRRVVDDWGPLYRSDSERPSQMSLPNITVTVNPQIQQQRTQSGKPSLPPEASRHGITVARWQFWTALVVALIGGLTTYLALRHGGAQPQINVPTGH